MTEHINHLGQPVGFPVSAWSLRERPPRTLLHGRHCRVEALDSDRHARDLFDAYGEDRDARIWTYLPWGPYAGLEDFLATTETDLQRENFITFTVVVCSAGECAAPTSMLPGGYEHRYSHRPRSGRTGGLGGSAPCRDRRARDC